jgi:predicted DCC family thiol-disulfide oxidoreductase YuxK
MLLSAASASPAVDPDVDSAAHPVILFDGVCNLCNAAVNFIIDRDPEAVFRFTPLQSEVGQRLVRDCGLEGEDTLVLVERGRCAVRSTAALRIAGRLRAPWPFLRVLLAVPSPLRDAAYRIIARYRFDWFGRRDACRMPTPELRRRFLAYDSPTP